jgi:hypothetical protein
MRLASSLDKEGNIQCSELNSEESIQSIQGLQERIQQNTADGSKAFGVHEVLQ